MRNVHRRTFILGGAAVASSIALPSAGATGVRATATSLPHDPFQLGVASGDPSADGFVLWTRLAPAPLNPDGRGGMPSSNVDVQWQVATDGNFATIVASGTTTATPASAHSVHVELSGLDHSRFYYYRFRTDTAPSYLSPTGRTRTAPGQGVLPNQLRFAVASCAHWEEAWFHAYRQIANDNPDLVLFLGDYIYEFSTNKTTNVREYVDWGTDVVDTLAEYRLRYAQHRTDPALRAAHAAAPWVVVFDDHEVKNNWNNSTPSATQRAQAFQAWYENMPVRAAQKPQGGAMTMHRRLGWGSLARFHMLDTRQYRSPQSTPDCNDGTRRMISSNQEQWLLDGLATHPATWDFLGQQVFFADRDRDRNPNTCDGDDSWDGYRPQRSRISAGWVERGVPNPVLLTGDVHRHWAADLLANPYAPDSAHIGVELVTTSVSSGGPSADPTDPEPGLPDHLPHVKYLHDRRGYIRCTATSTQLTAEFMQLSSTTEPDFAKVSVTPHARFVVPEGEKRLLRG
ncbi:phosphodiesterase [Lentzea sp. NEAU-D13]|uniref:Phosphodiesterase n=1 Tax=Lentzea alba TaxID=2714351 RepID=A0A7C9VUW8_9PSEU|nr:alkaline phosphatase D family protein [Lentzea alba]NGY65214.1 phosphodiesterase [Lentzea alba]